MAAVARRVSATAVSWRGLATLTSVSLAEQIGHKGHEIKHPTFEGCQEAHFPCLPRLQKDVAPVNLKGAYGENLSGFSVFKYEQSLRFKHGGLLPCLDIAYETWGRLNSSRSNAILLHTGLSASSHACSHPRNKSKGWWEQFIGPGCALDTDKFFIICSNIVGGCYGSSGPSSINPLTDLEYGMSFPVVSVEDMVRTQFLLLDYLGVAKLHTSIGSSLGGMQSIMAAALFPERVERVVSVSACLRTHPSSIAMRYVQRRIIMSDPNWKKGRYYGSEYPRVGMQNAREVATIGYRSGPEWASRFGHKRSNPDAPPDFCPDFQIETYLDRQGEKFCTSYDPNSLLYISKAMDMFDMGEGHSSLLAGTSRVTCPVLVLGVTSDILFPVEQQREMAALLKESGNEKVTFYELSSMYGHDTFMLDVNNLGVAIKGYLESQVQ